MKPESSTLDVFVYGTLKPGEANYLTYCEGIAVEIAGYIRGDLYALPLGYPGITTGNCKVYGVLLRFYDTDTLTSLDRLEDYQAQRASELNLYNRRLVTVYDSNDRAIAQAWAYFMALSKIKQYGGKKLLSGNWTGCSVNC